MRHIRLGLAVVATCVVAASLASGRTWNVRKDGTGDYTVIQDAVDHAAAGDTIQIGPGRYAEHAPFSAPGWTEEACVAVTKDNLTLIGSGADVTIIGASVAKAFPLIPKGIAALSSIASLVVQGLTVENIQGGEGIYRGGGRLEVRDCIIRSCDTGIVAWTNGGLVVGRCTFLGIANNAIATYAPATNVTIQDCHFEGNREGIVFANGTTSATARHCSIEGGSVGFQLSNGSTAVLEDCTISAVQTIPVYVAIASYLSLTGNQIEGGLYTLYVDSECLVTGTENVLGGASFRTIYSVYCDLSLHGNHILNGGGWSVYADGYADPGVVTLDLTDNYWGTTDGNQIAAWIRDMNDDPSVHCVVDYEPFANGPLGTEKKSWGELKTLYAK